MHRLVIALAIVLCLGLSAGAVSAQVPGDRTPYRGLFGGDVRDGESAQVSLSLFGAYDDNVVADVQPGSDPRYQVSGQFLGSDLSIDYTHAGERASYGGSAGASARYYSNLDGSTTFAYGGTGHLGFTLNPRAGLYLAQSVFVAPFYSVGSTSLLDVDPMDARPPTSDLAVHQRDGVGSQSRASFDYRLNRRDTFGMSYSFGIIDYNDENEAQRRHSAGASFGHRISRYSTLRLGYGYRKYSLTSRDGSAEAHDILAGLDYSRPLSLSGRRTVLTITPGTSLATRNGSLEVRLAGTAILNHQMGRSWTASLQYRRGIQFLDGLDAPVDGDSVSANLGGYLSRRLDLAISGRYVSGRTIQEQGTETGYDALFGSARMRFALFRGTGVFAEYLYYHYLFGNDVVLPVGFEQGLDRHGVRVGLVTMLPIFR